MSQYNPCLQLPAKGQELLGGGPSITWYCMMLHNTTMSRLWYHASCLCHRVLGIAEALAQFLLLLYQPGAGQVVPLLLPFFSKPASDQEDFVCMRYRKPFPSQFPFWGLGVHFTDRNNHQSRSSKYHVFPQPTQSLELPEGEIYMYVCTCANSQAHGYKFPCSKNDNCQA